MIFSILIPTKDYTKGLKRILENIPEKNLNIKIIISDDSSNNKSIFIIKFFEPIILTMIRVVNCLV